MRGKESKGPPPVSKILPAEVQGKEQNYGIDIVVVRLIFAITLTLVAYYSHPFGFEGAAALAVGIGSAIGIIFFEHRLKGATLKRLIGAAIGSIMGIIGASLISHMLTDTVFDTNSLSFINPCIVFIRPYVGQPIGPHKGALMLLPGIQTLLG